MLKKIIKNVFGRRDDRLPLLEFVSSQFPDVDLSNISVIACQHLLGTTFNLFEELFKKGLKPKNVYLIGKCYSTNEETYQKFIRHGVNVSELSKTFDSHISFDEQFHGYVGKFLQNVTDSVSAQDYKKIVILDDGGGLVSLVNDFFDNFDNFVGVEQTSSGYEKIKNVDLLFPVINIARSRAKLEYESPMVAELITQKIKNYIKDSGLSEPEILVIGQGYIGEAITKLLRQEFRTIGCDILPDKCDFNGDYKSDLNGFDIIVGASGNPVLAAGDFGKLKKGVALISASSSDREFSAIYLRVLDPKTDDCHKDFNVKGINLINGGFPINFDGQEHSLSPEKIQLTRALLLAGVYIGINANGGNGVKELDDKIQNSIIKKFITLK